MRWLLMHLIYMFNRYALWFFRNKYFVYMFDYCALWYFEIDFSHIYTVNCCFKDTFLVMVFSDCRFALIVRAIFQVHYF